MKLLFSPSYSQFSLGITFNPPMSRKILYLSNVKRNSLNQNPKITREQTKFSNDKYLDNNKIYIREEHRYVKK